MRQPQNHMDFPITHLICIKLYSFITELWLTYISVFYCVLHECIILTFIKIMKISLYCDKKKHICNKTNGNFDIVVNRHRHLYNIFCLYSILLIVIERTLD